jgi:uncharacterized protein with PQ loop repeat
MAPDHGMHHFQKRKRIYQEHEPYPHPNKWKRTVDTLIYPIVMFGPVMTIPQLWNIWIDKNAAGVSAISWGAYMVTSTFWLIYGIMHKEKPIIFSSCLWIILQALIVLGTLMYG